MIGSPDEDFKVLKVSYFQNNIETDISFAEFISKLN